MHRAHVFNIRSIFYPNGRVTCNLAEVIILFCSFQAACYKRVSNVNYNVTSSPLLLLTSTMYAASFELQCNLVLRNVHSNLLSAVTSTKNFKARIYTWILSWTVQMLIVNFTVSFLNDHIFWKRNFNES